MRYFSDGTGKLINKHEQKRGKNIIAPPSPSAACNKNSLIALKAPRLLRYCGVLYERSKALPLSGGRGYCCFTLAFRAKRVKMKLSIKQAAKWIQIATEGVREIKIGVKSLNLYRAGKIATILTK